MASHRSMAIVPVARVLDRRLDARCLRVALWLVVQIDRGTPPPVSVQGIAADLNTNVDDVTAALVRLRELGILYDLELGGDELSIGFDFAAWESAQ